MKQAWRNESTDGARSAVKIARDFDFPRESVFRMFTDAKKAVKFWGPEGSVKLVFELDPRPGGALRIHDRHSDGVTSKTTGNVLEIVVPERLVFRSATAIGDSSPPFEALQTLTFEALGPSKTRVTALVKVLALGSFPAEVEALEGGFEGGWGQTFDMLQRELV